MNYKLSHQESGVCRTANGTTLTEAKADAVDYRFNVGGTVYLLNENLHHIFRVDASAPDGIDILPPKVYTARVNEISAEIKACTEGRYLDILPKVQEIARISGLICYFGWNEYYHEWNWCYMASKPRKGYLDYLGSYKKVWPNGKVAVKLGGRWESI